jgi:hypothetical protein
VASGNVPIGPLLRWQFRGITLFAAQRTKVAKEIAWKLRVRIAG